MTIPNQFRICALQLATLTAGCGDRAATIQSTNHAVAVTTQPSTKIDSFSGEYRFLSNFWPVEVEFEGIVYPSVEHAYQSAKTLDMAERRRIAALATPGEAKAAGRARPLRTEWDTAKFDVMERCVRYKFTHHADLRTKLLATGDAELIEGNTWGDRVWGVHQGQGENHLGRILMKVRAELRAAN